jgi:hypothetical protein
LNKKMATPFLYLASDFKELTGRQSRPANSGFMFGTLLNPAAIRIAALRSAILILG